MGVLDNKELSILSVMYEGDKARDASSKIRGFLFQDYITIDCLLREKVEYVCSEYLEDVDVFFEDNTFEFIQVKYYPNTYPDRKEISTDLYYQYLRLQMLCSKLKAKPRLFIHYNNSKKTKPIKEIKPTLEEMKEYVGGGDNLPKKPKHLVEKDVSVFLKQNVYKTNKKEEQKEKLFSALASEESIEKFIEDFKILYKENIIQYKNYLKNRLVEVYLNPNQNKDREKWSQILLGLAISYIQRRYTKDDSDFYNLRVGRKEFDEYIIHSLSEKPEKSISSYLVGCACELYGNIIKNNDLTDSQLRLLNLIYRNTIQWIHEICKTVEGQHRLLNTISLHEADVINGYRIADNKLDLFKESKSGFFDFLGYLWKIMLDICQENVKDIAKIPFDSDLVNPIHYMDFSVTDYVCFHFPEDKFFRHSIILPQGGNRFKGAKRRIVERIIKMSPRPEKWFFSNNELKIGKNYYDYNTANVIDNPTVADLGEDSFYIECMDCIRIDEGDWSVQEKCSNCIFSERCKKEVSYDSARGI